MRVKKYLSLLYICLLGAIVPGRAQVNMPVTNQRVSATPVTRPSAYKTLSASSVRTWEPSMQTTDENAVFDSSRSVGEVKQIIQYLDGLGRPLQTVAKKISPAGKDMVTAVVYDSLGREQFKYLPYVQQGDNFKDGKLKADPFASQVSFYQNVGLNPGIAGEHIYYAQVEYESSPLNRVLKTYAPGDSWAKTGGNHPVEIQYLLNTTADSVRIWNISISQQTCAGASVYRSGSGDLPLSNNIYDAGQLYKGVSKDEAGHLKVEYKDKDGHVILKKVQLSETPGTAHVGWLCTYYVYDDLSNLRFVIPPQAVQIILGNWNVSTVANELCFQYKYDSRQRLIQKKVPGAGPTLMVYDNRNRVVFRQDSVQRKQTSPQWLTTYYDGLNRPVMTALYAASTTRDALQCSINASNGDTVVTIVNVDTLQADLSVSTYNSTISNYMATNTITFLPEFTSADGATFDASIVNSGGTATSVANNPIPNIASSALTPLSYTYYDNYNYDGKLSFESSAPGKLDAGYNDYAEVTTVQSAYTNGLVTGSKIRILGTDQWLISSIYYDDKGRTLEKVSSNSVNGKEIIASLYNFNNKTLSTYLSHTNPRSLLTPQTSLLTTLNYDDGGRLLSIKKRINDDPAQDKIIAAHSYNELAMLQQKRLGVTGTTQLDTLTYTYNIRGWIQGINKAFVNTGSTDNWFGQELDYDNGFSTNQYNGNVSGIKWKSRSNGIPRAYGYNYDATGRLIKADFNQQNTSGAAWTADKADFTVSNLTYDANGNIGSIKQQGLIGNAIGNVDNLSYTYQSGTNRLLSVNDSSKTTEAKLGDFNDGTNTGNDYTYDGNGSLVADQNKSISAITYNFLNQPEQVSFTSKGKISFLYDATGIMLKKTIIDSTVSPVKTTVTDYLGSFIYQQDTMQLISHEEGRIRPVYDSGKAVTFTYDYFEKDHLGDIRVVLGTKADTSVYAATMETAATAVENSLFSNIDNTRTALPSGYPADATTNPNAFVAKLNAVNGQKIGPSLVLRVMAGDTIQMGVKAFYKSTGTSVSGTTAESMLAALVQAFSGSSVNDGTHGSSGTNSAIATSFNSSEYDEMIEKDPSQNLSDKPKAYLNFATFDDQFNMVDDNSGVKQVQGAPDALQTLAVDPMIIKKTGFIYIYTSNESGEDMYFDNLVVVHNGGPLLEETHYYPFGLTMSGISASALKGKQYFKNRFKFNGKELNENEFSDNSGLSWYNYGMRDYDPQVGRFFRVDPIGSDFANLTPYQYAGNEPVKNVDLDGLEPRAAVESWHLETLKPHHYNKYKGDEVYYVDGFWINVQTGVYNSVYQYYDDKKHGGTGWQMFPPKTEADFAKQDAQALSDLSDALGKGFSGLFYIGAAAFTGGVSLQGLTVTGVASGVGDASAQVLTSTEDGWSDKLKGINITSVAASTFIKSPYLASMIASGFQYSFLHGRRDSYFLNTSKDTKGKSFEQFAIESTVFGAANQYTGAAGEVLGFGSKAELQSLIKSGISKPGGVTLQFGVGGLTSFQFNFLSTIISNALNESTK